MAQLLLTFALVASAAVAVHTQDVAKGDALVAEARKALGGDERLLAVKTLELRGDFKRAAGQNTVEGQLQVRIERPDKLRRDEDTSPPGGGPAVIRTEVLNGATVWDENAGGFGGGRGFGGRQGGGAGRAQRDQAAGETPRVDPARLEEALRRARQAELTRLLLVLLLASDTPAAWIGVAEAPDGKADVLLLMPPNQPPIRLFLDVASHLPLMITWDAPAAGRRGAGTPPTFPSPTPRMTMAEYKTVNGIRLPHLITRGVGDRTVEEWTIESYRVNPAFRSDVFTK